jgi:hypothetical protein
MRLLLGRPFFQHDDVTVNTPFCGLTLNFAPEPDRPHYAGDLACVLEVGSLVAFAGATHPLTISARRKKLNRVIQARLRVHPRGRRTP